MKTLQILILLAGIPFFGCLLRAEGREKFNFNSGWYLRMGDLPESQAGKQPGKDWKRVTLPRAFNEDEAFKVSIEKLTDTLVWYKKSFKLPKNSHGKKVFIEFEGIRQAADFYLNGHLIGLHENGVMAVGFDLTPYLKAGKENLIALRIDNSWAYRERATQTRYQWVNKNFNANYGGIPKNVWLHVTDKLYQTLPLYSNLGTTGVYIYATDIRVRSRKAKIHAESEVRNEHKQPVPFRYEVSVFAPDGSLLKTFRGEEATLNPGETRIVKAEAELENLRFWSWGYGFLYKVRTRLIRNDKVVDEVTTRTGFRKTRFAEGKIWLNDRVLQMKGFAQRTSNEWPAVGMSVPAWLSDFSNAMMVAGNANLVRWMHVTPWKQDVESCDRVGLIQAMPAGDAERDCQGEQWRQRMELMRDAIIYNRNNPSILFYECGNESITRTHMQEMKAIRDQYDPYGGRAIGSREMLDIREAEYGGEMLYINKSAGHPLWAMEYSRDEGLRKYWDEYSYPFHREGAGPLYRNADASAYNHNQDELAIEGVRRWYDYWLERPGNGKRVSSGGAKIIFSDTNTHYRGEENYRRSGVTDAMRIPKEAFYAHQVMWDGWVDCEHPRTHLIGHWNYPPGTVKPVYVVSNGERVELYLNDELQKPSRREYQFLYTFDRIPFQQGELRAVSYDTEGHVLSSDTLYTTGAPYQIRLRLFQNPAGFFADGADMALIECEVTDSQGRRCPLANDLIRFELDGPAEWRGGIAQGPDNYILSHSLPVECGVNRALIRSTETAGSLRITAHAEGLKSATLTATTLPVEQREGCSTFFPGDLLPGHLTRGETPLTPSYQERKLTVPIRSATAGCHNDETHKSFDDNELSEWRNDGKLSTAWINYQLERPAEIDEICMKLTGWRMRSYSLEIFAGEQLIWQGDTDKSLGYVHLKVKPILSDQIGIRLKGVRSSEDAFGQIVEVTEPFGNELDLFKAKEPEKGGRELRIVEIEFLETLFR